MPPPRPAPLSAGASRVRAATIGTRRRTRRILASPDDEAECSLHRPEAGLARGHELAVDVETRAVGHLYLDLLAVQRGTRAGGSSGCRGAGGTPGSPGRSASPASIATTSSAPSVGSASSIDAPAPNAPDAATVTCHASPASSSRPSHSTRQVSGLRADARRSRRRPRRRAARAGPSSRRPAPPPGPAGPRSPRSRTGARPFIQPSSIDWSLVPCTASRQAAEMPSGSPSRLREVVGGPGRARPPAGCPPRPAAAAAGPMLPSPPATTSLSAPERGASSVSSMPKRSTSAPNAASRSAHRAASLDPERSFATRATVVRVCVRSPGVFPDASVPAMLLDPMGAQARVFVTRQLPGDGARPPGRASTTWRSGPSGCRRRARS